ncbi:MAG: RNA methyltransferase [Bacteroidales bacterium]|nr:RNA methyltransferase [Bacteroidales bacterium]MBN2758303.1 RNA methyltransferase [Bacteroidales bacterium]
MQKELINHLSQFSTENRWNLFKQIIEYRTKYITVVLEDIFQPHNASAVLRTADCFGIQDIHIIENENEYTLSHDVTRGSYKWLNLKKYNEKENNTLNTINELKSQGYRIVATTPHTNDVELENFDLSKGKTALLFGSEMPGLSKIAMENADEFLKIPMYGFTESFNISVSASIILHHLTYELRKSEINWQLSDNERDNVLLDWLRKTIKSSKLIEKAFLEKRK